MSKEPTYTPPFTVSAEAINMVAKISAQMERYAIRLEQEDSLRLRKANRIKTIHSSLAIEGNTLSENDVRDIFDGNGRMGRLWQSLILGKLHPLFEHLPVENMVYANQQQYYDAIAASTQAGQSGPFIDFMLGEIFKALKLHQGEELPNKLPSKLPNKLRLKYPQVSDVAWEVYQKIKENPRSTAEELGTSVGLSGRMVRNHISVLREAGLIERIGSNKTGYWKIV